MEVFAESAATVPARRTDDFGACERLVLRVAQLQSEVERLREENAQLHAALSVFSEVARRTQSDR